MSREGERADEQGEDALHWGGFWTKEKYWKMMKGVGGEPVEGAFIVMRR